MPHILIVGGTGMLSNVCQHFCNSARTVTVIARSQNRFNKLSEKTKHLSAKLNPLPLDYRDSKVLVEKLKLQIDQFGPIILVVCWVHESIAPDAVRQIAATIDKYNQDHKCKFYLLLSSAAADPSKEKTNVAEKFKSFKNISMRTIQLGFIIEKNSSRWLTNNEISTAVIDAIEKDRISATIGTVEPWEMRP